MDFLEAKSFVDGLSKYGSILGLESINKLLDKLNHPEQSLKVIHVAGTNGKGSTIAYIESILNKAKITTGKYTSPVVFEYLEKYQICGENISEDDFIRIVEKVKLAIDALNLEGIFPTVFEVETAMAFLYFELRKPDIVILETGMGGDMDATNVCDKVLLSVITSISLDHMAFLGNTVEEIATHKGGIIKNNCPVVLNGKNEQVVQVIKNIAKDKNSRLAIAGVSTKVIDGEYKSFDGTYFSGITSKLMGNYQVENIALAIEAVLMLNSEYPDSYSISIGEITDGIREAFLPGRFEKISENPIVYIDGAHNPDAIIKLKDTILTNFDGKKIVFIIGVLADKDYKEECRLIADIAQEIFTVTPDNPRALEAEKLAETISEINSKVCACYMLNEAYNRAYNSKADVIVAFGSLSYLAQFKNVVKLYHSEDTK